MNCNCSNERDSSSLVQKFLAREGELFDAARQMLKSAGDPVTAVLRFLAERPEGASLPGYVVNKVLSETFGEHEAIPALIELMCGHVREVVRRSNVIDIIKEHSTVEKWGNFMIKQKELIKFEVGFERGRIVLSNIAGLIGIEHGIELPLEKIKVNPPHLIVTTKFGCFRQQRIVEI